MGPAIALSQPGGCQVGKRVAVGFGDLAVPRD